MGAYNDNKVVIDNEDGEYLPYPKDFILEQIEQFWGDSSFT